MKAHVLKRSKQEIAENLVRISGEVREQFLIDEIDLRIGDSWADADLRVVGLFCEVDQIVVSVGP